MQRALSIWVLLTFSCLVRSQDGSDFLVEKEATISRNLGGYWRIASEIGDLPAGKRGKVVLKLVNTTNDDLYLGNTYSGCACASLVLSNEKVAAGGSVYATLTLTTPKNARVPEQSFSFVIGKGDQSGGAIAVVRYTLRGLITFRETTATYICRQEKGDFSFRIPLVVSDPNVDINDLSITGIGGFKESKTKIVKHVETLLAECTVPAESVDNVGLSGEFQLNSPQLAEPQTILCTVLRPAEVEIVPSILRLKWDEESKGFIANAILRVDAEYLESLASEEARKKLTDPVSVRLSYPNAKLHLRKHEIKKGVYRISIVAKPDLKLEDSLLNSRKEELIWFVSVLGKEVAVRTVAEFIKDQELPK